MELREISFPSLNRKARYTISQCQIIRGHINPVKHFETLHGQ